MGKTIVYTLATVTSSASDHHYHHQEHTPDWSVAVSLKCLQRVRF